MTTMIKVLISRVPRYIDFNWREKQVSSQWPHRPAAGRSDAVPIRAAQHQQSALPDHARSDYKGPQHEATRDSIHD